MSNIYYRWAVKNIFENFPKDIESKILEHLELKSRFLSEEDKQQYEVNLVTGLYNLRNNYLSGGGFSGELRTIELYGSPIQWDYCFNIVSNCKCCKEHQKNRPKQCNTNYNYEFKNNREEKSCKCLCRHVCRMMNKAVQNNISFE